MFFAAAHGQAPAWTDYSSKEQQFTISFPGEPNVSKTFVDEKQGNKYTFVIGDDHHAYIVMVCDVRHMRARSRPPILRPGMTPLEKPRSKICRARRLVSETDLKIGGVPSSEFIGDSDQWFYRGRYILTRGRIYGIMALVSRSLETDADTKTAMAKFLDSFHFN